MGRIFPLLYWLGLAVVLAGIVVRFWLAQPQWGLKVAVAGLRERMRQAGRPGRWGLKTPAGGYYDVDFIVSRRLLEAGITAWGEGGLAGGALRLGAEGLAPAEVAAQLASHAAFLRAADHALRAATGRAAQHAPASGEAVERAAAWLRRTRPDAAGLEAGVEEACQRIREIYRVWR